MTRMAYFVYILQSEGNDSYYVGQTANLEERLNRHNQGRSKYSKRKGRWRLVYHEVYGSRAEAMRREKEIKRKKSRKYIEQLVRASRV